MTAVLLVVFSLLAVSLSHRLGLTPISEAVKVNALTTYAPDTVLHTDEVISNVKLAVLTVDILPIFCRVGVSIYGAVQGC